MGFRHGGRRMKTAEEIVEKILSRIRMHTHQIRHFRKVILRNNELIDSGKLTNEEIEKAHHDNIVEKEQLYKSEQRLEELKIVLNGIGLRTTEEIRYEEKDESK